MCEKFNKLLNEASELSTQRNVIQLMKLQNKLEKWQLCNSCFEVINCVEKTTEKMKEIVCISK
jgi:hypothetical protein